MKNTSINLLICLAMTFAGCQTSTTENSISLNIDEEKQLVRKMIEEDWPTAYEVQDTVLLAKILHPTFRLVDDQGQVYKKSDEVSYVAQYGTSYDTYQFEIAQLEVYENGTAKVLGKGAITGSDVDGNYALNYQASYSLIKEAGRWQVIHNHVSGVKEDRY